MWEPLEDCGCYYGGYDFDDELCMVCEGHGKLKSRYSSLNPNIKFKIYDRGGSNAKS